MRHDPLVPEAVAVLLAKPLDRPESPERPQGVGPGEQLVERERRLGGDADQLGDVEDQAEDLALGADLVERQQGLALRHLTGGPNVDDGGSDGVPKDGAAAEGAAAEGAGGADGIGPQPACGCAVPVPDPAPDPVPDLVPVAAAEAGPHPQLPTICPAAPMERC